MPRIPSPNPDFPEIPVPSENLSYPHPTVTKKGAIPLAFQVTSPFNNRLVLLPHALVLHVNPLSLQESSNQKKSVIQTRGGFVEQHWGHELVEIQADQSTGAFMNIRTGLTSILRRKTIAWDRYRDLHDLYRNNGSLHDPYGNIVLQGDIMLMYDKGVYLGFFKSFDWEDTAESPFAFKLSWTFKVTTTLLSIDPNFGGREQFSPIPAFQGQNISVTSGGSQSAAAAAASEQPVPATGSNAIPDPGDINESIAIPDPGDVNEGQ